MKRINGKLTRILSFIIAVVMTGSVLIGCGTSSQKSAQSGSKKLAPVTLKFYIPGNQPPSKNDVLNYLSEKTKDKLNAKFEINFVPFGDYTNKLTMMAASGDNYDAAFTADWFGFSDLVNKGAFLGLNDVMPKYAPNLYKVYKDNNMLQQITVKNQIMAVPWTCIKTSKPTFEWRQDIADKLGVQSGDVTTIDGVDKFLTAVAAKNPGMPVFDLNISGTAMYGDIVNFLTPKYELYSMGYHSFFMDLNDKTHKVIPLEQTPMFTEAVKLAKKWYDSGVISKDALSNKSKTDFKDGKAFSSKNIDEALYEVTTFSDKSAKLGCAEIYPDKKFARDSQLNNAMAVNKNAANPERTMMFMDLITTNKDVYNTLWYGIKDKTYTVDSKGVIGYTKGEDPSKPLWQGWMAWGFCRDNFQSPTATRSADAIKKESEFVKRSNIVMPPTNGFIPDPQPIKTELAKRDQLYEEQGKLLLAGIVKGDVDKAIQDYVNKQKTVGLDKITAEIQKQIDANVK